MSRLIDGDELIAWIKGSQQMTSKMRNVICKVEVMQGREFKWEVIREDKLVLNVKCPKCGARYHFAKHQQGAERTRWKCCPTCLTPIKGWRKKKNERHD